MLIFLKRTTLRFRHFKSKKAEFLKLKFLLFYFIFIFFWWKSRSQLVYWGIFVGFSETMKMMRFHSFHWGSLACFVLFCFSPNHKFDFFLFKPETLRPRLVMCDYITFFFSLVFVKLFLYHWGSFSLYIHFCFKTEK